MAARDKRCFAEDCRALASHVCSGCKTANYCSRECQKKDWKIVHKAQCIGYRARSCESMSADGSTSTLSNGTVMINYGASAPSASVIESVSKSASASDPMIDASQAWMAVHGQEPEMQAWMSHGRRGTWPLTIAQCISQVRDRSGKSNGQYAAAMLTEMTAYNPANIIAVGECGGITPLISMVRDGTATAKNFAARVLTNL